MPSEALAKEGGR